MKISEILISIEAALKVWAKPHAGTVHLAGDPLHLFSLLGDKPGGVRAAIMVRDGQKRGEYEEAGQEDVTFLVVVSRGRGFKAEPADNLVRGSGGGAPLYDLVEQIRDVVRGIDLDDETTEVTFDFKGFGPYHNPFEILADAYQLEFSIGRQLPGITAGATGSRLGLSDGSVLGIGAESVLGISQ